MDDDSSDSEIDSYVTIGTALQPYEEGEALKKPIAIQEQSVKDTKGRSRFHGAFTGGYSAGYFNTVGSKEGFTPGQFVSSKSQRNEKNTQKPEDFMDEEDFGEHGIAPKVVTATDDFSLKRRKRKEKSEDPLTDLIVPTSSLTVGLKLLKHLGWKEGQGVGARVTRKHQRTEKKKKVYGCALPGAQSQSSGEESDDDYVPDGITFAPRDVNPFKFTPKDNMHGLGYSGISRSSALSAESVESKRGPFKKGGKLGISGQAFGVGEYEDEEDMDVYALDTMSNYDAVLSDPVRDHNHGWTAPKFQGMSSAPVGYIGKVLEGFKLSTSSLKNKKTFPAPQLPRDFRPFYSEGGGDSSRATHTKLNVKTVNSNVRKNILGEAGSVFELVSVEDKAKMEAAKNTAARETMELTSAALSSLISASNTSTPGGESVKTTSHAPLNKTTPEFKPFARDAEKQARYEKYLDNKKKGKVDEIPIGSMTEWERSKEMHEFSRAADLYRPLSSLMASRFTAAKYEDSDNTVEMLPNELTDKKDQKNAAEMKMFGKMTREKLEWHPDKLLCKRFNIANPYPDSTLVGVPKVKRDKFSVFNFLSNPAAVASSAAMEVQDSAGGHDRQNESDDVGDHKTLASLAKRPQSKLKPLAILANDEVVVKPVAKKNTTNSSVDTEEQQKSTEENERPSMDIFKAIFSDSDSDDSSGAESENQADKIVNNSANEKVSAELTSLFGEKSAAVMAEKDTGTIPVLEKDTGTIPVESLEKRLSPPVHNTPAQYSTVSGTSPSTPATHQTGAIGSLISSTSIQSESEDNDAMWTEKVVNSGDKDKSKKHKHRHKLKKKKSKHKKHKTKHKKDKKSSKKKKKKEVTSSSDSEGSDSDSDIDDKLINRIKSFQQDRRSTAADFM